MFLPKLSMSLFVVIYSVSIWRISCGKLISSKAAGCTSAMYGSLVGVSQAFCFWICFVNGCLFFLAYNFCIYIYIYMYIYIYILYYVIYIIYYVIAYHIYYIIYIYIIFVYI